MLIVLLVALIILWFFGYIVIPGIVIPSVILFYIHGFPVTLWNLLIFLIMLVIIGSLPSPFREILAVIFLVWILSLLGFIGAVGLPNLLIVAVIAGLLVYVLQGRA